MAWVRVQWRCSRSRGTGEVPPTGRTLRLPLCDLFEVAAGRVARIHAYYDQIPFAAHLELLPLSGSYTRGAICFPAVAAARRGRLSHNVLDAGTTAPTGGDSKATMHRFLAALARRSPLVTLHVTPAS